MFSQVMRSDGLQPDLAFARCISNTLFLWILCLVFVVVYILVSLRGTEEKGDFEDHLLFFTRSAQFPLWKYQKRV